MTPYETIIRWCEAHEVSVTALAARAGIRESMIRQLGSGVTKKGRPRALSRMTAMKLAAVMGVPVDRLLPPPGTPLYGRAAQKVKVIPLPRQMQKEADIADMLKELLENQRKLLQAIEPPVAGRRTPSVEAYKKARFFGLTRTAI